MTEQIKMKLKDKIIILLFVIMLSIVLCLLWYREEPIRNDNLDIQRHIDLIDSINIKLDSLQRHDDKIDTTINSKNTYYIYEKNIFKDSLVISDDSVDKFIASYLKTR